MTIDYAWGANICTQETEDRRQKSGVGMLTANHKPLTANDCFYDCQNRLTDVNDQSNSRVASYKYDYLGRLVKRTVGSATIKYVYDGDGSTPLTAGQIIAEYDANDTLLRKFVCSDRIDEPVCMVTAGGTKYYYHFDGLGSVVALSNSAGNIVEKYSYDVFGEPNRTSSINNPYFFTGRAYDSNVKLYYYRARFYSPALGRFLQPDPAGYEASGLNLYTYVGNNPVRWVDPLGLWYIDINWSFGWWVGITGGIQMGPQGTSSYLGGGLMTPPGGVSVFFSPNDISPGWAVGVGGGSLVGGQGGYGFGEGGGWYGEGGATTPGASATAVYVRPPKPKPPKPPKPPGTECQGDFPPLKPFWGGEYA
jgi:RHS repeat-associated protein